jgi:hypothetical protein
LHEELSLTAWVLQTAQNWPEIAGSKSGVFAIRVKDFNGLAQNPIRRISVVEPEFCFGTSFGHSKPAAAVPQRHAQTLYDKIWSDHLVVEEPGGTCLLYLDRHIVHEVDSPQAFGGLRRAGLSVRAPEKTLLVVDHNVPTSDRTKPNPDPESAAQIAYFAENAELFGLEYYSEFDKRQGIFHVVGPEQGFTLPGTVDCLWRQPHHYPWRVRRTRLRYWHLRGRARTRANNHVPQRARRGRTASGLT